jgi:glycyl-radical enzyme activating protein family
MKGVIFDIDHFAVHDGPGIRTVVYLKGCPLRCKWCHSPESHIIEPQVIKVNDAEKMCGKYVTADEVISEIIDDKPFYESSGGGVTLSGGEVLFQADFTLELLRKLRKNEIHTLVETSGMGNWNDLACISEYTDIFYYDLKIIDSERHKKYTGADNSVILDNLKKLMELRNEKNICIRVPLIPSYTDAKTDIDEIYKFTSDIGLEHVELLPYNKSAAAKYEWLGIEYPLNN